MPQHRYFNSPQTGFMLVQDHPLLYLLHALQTWYYCIVTHLWQLDVYYVPSILNMYIHLASHHNCRSTPILGIATVLICTTPTEHLASHLYLYNWKHFNRAWQRCNIICLIRVVRCVLHPVVVHMCLQFSCSCSCSCSQTSAPRWYLHVITV